MQKEPRKRQCRVMTANAEGIPRVGLLRRSQVLQMFGISNSTLRRRIDEGVFPEPISIKEIGGDRIRYWWADEVWPIMEKDQHAPVH